MQTADAPDIIAMPTPASLREEAVDAAIEAAGRAAALAVARLNRSLGNPMERQAQDSYIINSQYRLGDAEKRFYRALERLHGMYGLEAALPVVYAYNDALERIRRRRHLGLERLAKDRQGDFGFDQAPGLAFDGGDLHCDLTTRADRPNPGRIA